MHDSYRGQPPPLNMESSYDVQHGQHQFGTDAGLDVSGCGDHSAQPSPPAEFGRTAFDFSSPTRSTFEPAYSVEPFQQPFPAPQPLHPLTSPATLWPSQLTNPSAATSPPPVPLQPRPAASESQDKIAPSPAKAVQPASAPAKQAQPNQRKTLTDNDRRRMCKYHEENPTVKQTEIGALFGVERSTVSKVLRNKDKYLVGEDGRKSPVKRSKGKFPDVERTLGNWAKNRMAEGLPVDDELIRDEARKFASTLGTTECRDQINDPVWLEKFKQKLQVPGARPKGDQITADNISPKSGSSTPNELPSTTGRFGIALNPLKTAQKTASPDEISSGGAPWNSAATQSSASLGSFFAEASHYSTEMTSPTSPVFTSGNSGGPSPIMPALKMPRLPGPKISSLSRRQTVPLVGTTAADTDPLPITSSTGYTHPSEEMSISPMGIGPSQPGRNSRPPTVAPVQSESHRTQNSTSTSTTSPLSLYPPSSASTNISPIIGSLSSSPNVSTPSSPPSQDEARAALETLKTFLEHQPNGAIDPHDYLVMGKWMQMLKLESGALPGGMHAFPMVERADGTTPVGRKRSEHSLT